MKKKVRRAPASPRPAKARKASPLVAPHQGKQNAYFIGFSGNRVLGEIAHRDFFPMIDSSLKSSGFTDDPSDFSLRPSGKRSFRADASQSWASAITVYILIQAAGWVCRTVFDEIYKPNIRPALKKALNSLLKRDQALANPSFDFSTWLEPIQVLVTIRISGSSVHGIVASEKQAKTAFQFAEDWLRSKGATHKYITVVIHDGVLCNIPLLSNDAPTRRQVTHFP